MSAHIQFKNLLYIFLGGLACAVGMAFFTVFMLSGPKLGPHYDFLLTKKTPNVSRDILIINTEEYIDGGDFFSVLMTLTEMEASDLILASALSPSAAPITVTEDEIKRRFTEEYLLVSSNIRNLFEGIRMGSVSPRDAPNLVDQVIELAEKGRDRLVSAFIDRDEDLVRSVAVFGNFLECYSKPRLDKDGKLRRVTPVEKEENIEHPVYKYMKRRYASAQFDISNSRNILLLRDRYGNETKIQLDKNADVITAGSSFFRHIDIELFREYKQAEDDMRSALEKANELKLFSHISPDNMPLILDDYSRTLLAELLRTPVNENRSAWINARNGYYKSLEEFFNDSQETELISGYEDKIADLDSSNEDELAGLIEIKNELINVFNLMRGAYEKLLIYRERLKPELSLSLCVMGVQSSAGYCAMLANVMITGSHIKPAGDLTALLWSILASFIVLFAVLFFSPVILLCAGFVLSFACAVFFGFIFVYFSYWIDPVIAFSSSLAGMLVIFFFKNAILSFQERSFRMAYKTAVSKEALRKIIAKGKPNPSDVNVTYAAIIAIKDFNLFGKEGIKRPMEAVKLRRNFYSLVKKVIFNAGAVIVGYEGNTIIACFGSPLEPHPVLTTYKMTEDGVPAKTYNPVEKACSLVRELLKIEKISWRFGIDSGLCSFSWSPENGYTASGPTAVRARMLVSKTKSYHVRALITEIVREKIELSGSWVGYLHDENDSVFELKV